MKIEYLRRYKSNPSRTSPKKIDKKRAKELETKLRKLLHQYKDVPAVVLWKLDLKLSEGVVVDFSSKTILDVPSVIQYCTINCSGIKPL